MSATSRLLQLSPYVIPQMQMGGVSLVPENLSDVPDKLAYLEGAAAHINGLGAFSGMLDVDALRQFVGELQGRHLLDIGLVEGKLRAAVRAEARDELLFDRARLTTVFFDGRAPLGGQPLALRTGADTPGVGELVAALTRGTREDALLALAARVDVGFDRDVLEGLLAEGVADVTPDGPAPTAAQFSGDGERVTWLGHAAAVFQSSGTTLWVDPLLWPRHAWLGNEAEQVFSEGFAESQLIENYGPDFEQLSVVDLPAPDAVLITHQDNDHFDLGVLMTLPEHTVIVVPRATGERPWDVNLAKVIRDTLGPKRRVYQLAHGETCRFGDVEVTALPFRGEYPTALETSWNIYLVEARRTAVAFCADAAVDDANVDAIAARVRARGAALTVLTYRPHVDGDAVKPSFTDNPLVMHNTGRLWGWYLRPCDRFVPSRQCGVSYALLERLRREVGAVQHFLYAMSGMPYYRLPRSPIQLDALTTSEFAQYRDQLDAVGVGFAPLKYGRPLRLG